MAIELGEDDALAEAESATVATTWTTKVAEIISRAFHSETNQFGTAALRDVGNGEGNIRALNANGKIPQASTRIPVRDFSPDEFKDYGILGTDFVPGSITFREIANGAIPYTAFDIQGTPTEGARVVYDFGTRTLNWDADFGNIIGEIQIFPHSSTIAGWLPCDGRSLSRTTYARLFKVISTNYGNVDDDHFNLPDLSGRVVGGRGTTDSFSAVGKTGGVETHTLTEEEIPSHTHLVVVEAQANRGRYPQAIPPLLETNYLGERVSRRNYGLGEEENQDYRLAGTTILPSIGLLSESGSDTAHQNLQPYIVQEYRIFIGV